MAEPPTKILQLVDEHGRLASNEEIDYFMQGLPENITVVSIIGPQNTGKSHLLNCLFGTKFKTLPTDENWGAVTHGIWIGSCTHDSSMVIMDVEGADSIQRAQDETTSFDYKAAFLALKISHVLLVNLDCRNVGQNNGGCVPLLRMIFLETIRQHMGRPRVVMTIRDCQNPEHPRDQSRAVRQMVETWESVHGQRRNIILHDFIEVSAELFPYLRPEEDFLGKCSELREKLTPDRLRRGHNPGENLNITAATFSTNAVGLTNSVKRQVIRHRRETIINEQKSKFRDVLNTEREKRTEENKRIICTKLQNMKKGIFSSIFTFSFDFKAFEDLQVDNVTNPHIKRFNDSFNAYIYFDEYIELVNECKSRHKDDLKVYAEKAADRLQLKHQIFVGIGKVSLLLLATHGAYISARPIFLAVKFIVVACGNGLLKFEKPAIDGLTYIYEMIILPATKQAVKSAVPKLRQQLSVAMLALLIQFMSRENYSGTKVP